MVLKKNVSVLEGSVFVGSMGFYVRNCLPDELLGEIQGFVQRNTIFEKEGKKYCCLRCLKAHAISKAREMKLGERAEKILDEAIDDEIGHGEHYLDDGELRKIIS